MGSILDLHQKSPTANLCTDHPLPLPSTMIPSYAIERWLSDKTVEHSDVNANLVDLTQDQSHTNATEKRMPMSE